MLLYWLCFALASVIIFWLLIEIKYLQKEVKLLEDELIKTYEAMDKHLNR